MIQLPTDHFSVSQSNMYARCPAQYEFRYVQGLIIPPAIAMVVGSSIHDAAQFNHTQKVESHEDLPASNLEDIAAEQYRVRVEMEDVLLTEEEKPRKSKALDDGQKRTLKLAGLYAGEVAPTVQPVPEGVERKVTLTIPDYADVIGYVDAIDTEIRLREFKTHAEKKNAADIACDPQLTFYSLALHKEFEAPLAALRWDNMICTKAGKLSYQWLETDRAAQDYDALLRRLCTQMQAISAGIFPPCPPGSWMCSSRWCGYWHMCPYVNAERRA